MKRFKFLTLIIAIILFIGLGALNSVTTFAEATGGQEEFEVDPTNNLEEIRIPIFPTIPISDANASLLSWLSFIAGIVVLGIAIFWVYLLLRAGVKAMGSRANDENLQDAYKRFKSTLIGASLAIGFPIVITIIGIGLGIGPLWNWPSAFRQCEEGRDNRYYFQAYLDVDSEGKSTDQIEAEAESLCF